MHIIEIILDGFKSYPTRTQISNFDQQFNAITGLNGSGKSNIIDAICFVLGISSLQHVRVSNLQELIYKQGNAGVNKAQVTIVFDNSNKKTSPPALIGEDKIHVSRQIFEGKSQYRLNGKVETADKIKSIFMQVQLNVNNPHFLVMQGRIAQVINMKPDQLLSLVEEASGTSLYENRKLASLKIISKKQTKLDEISSIVLQEIAPQLERLRKDKELYERYRSNETELGALWKQIVAYEYFNTDKNRGVKQLEADRLRQEGEELVRTIDMQKSDIDSYEEEIQAAKRNDITTIRQQWDVMQKDMVRLDKDLVDKQATLKNLEKNLKDNENVQKKLSRYIDDLHRNFDKNKKRREEVMLLVRKYKREYDLKKEQLKQIVQNLRDINEGKDIAVDEGVGLKIQQLNETKKNLEITSQEIKQVTTLILRLEREKKEVADNLANLQASNESIRAQIVKVQGDLKAAQEQLVQRQFNQRAESEKSAEKKKIEDQLKEINKKLETLSVGTEQKLDIKFKLPTEDFDRSLVRGRVAQLFSIKEDRYATALEAIAGNKLYHIVVDNDIAASILLKNDCFKYRVNLVPNNKIEGKEIKKEVVDYVRNVTRGRAKFGLELIKYHVHVENTMKYIFGNVIICEDSETAKKLAFDPYVKMKTVTIDGDIYNPTGVLEGGHTAELYGMLRKVKDIQRLDEEKKHLSSKLLELQNEIQQLKKKAQDYSEKETEIVLQEHQLRLLKERLDVDQRDQLQIRLKNLEEDLEESMKKESQLTEFQSKYREEVEHITFEINEFENRKDRKKELLEDMHAKLKSEIELVTRELKENQREVDKLEYEGEENEKDMKSSKEQIAKEIMEHSKLSDEIEELRRIVEDYAKLRLEKRERMKTLQADQIKATSKIKEHLEQKQKLEKAREVNLVEIRKLDTRIQKLQVEVNDLQGKLTALERENTWVINERQMFGNPESAEYRFETNFNMVEKTRRFYKLKEETAGMKKHVNMRVDNMADQAERDYTELIKKRDRVMVDKDRIEQTIKELDALKNQTLMGTYLEVNNNFKKIFSTLLPGAMASIDLEDLNNIQAGVKIRVGFGNDWKENLSELSGGQRSLLALSFVLSLLKYKPAPLYILDEIDAALDLSHTQNIGKMIKQHFPESQFLIISLKEGMFSNANVLFKVEFQEGKSKITRYQQQIAKKVK